MKKSTTTAYGYTLVELAIVITLSGIFIVGLFASLTSIITLYNGTSQRTAASNLAYANMRLYADGTIPTWFICNTSNQTGPQTLLNRTASVDGLPGDTAQTVVATAIYGCNEASHGNPIRVVSTVKTSNGIETSHATYAAY